MEENETVQGKDVPRELIVLPLKGTVIYPQTVIPVIVESAKSQLAVRKAMETSHFIGTFLQETKSGRSKGSGGQREGSWPEAQVGTACLIHKVIPISKISQMVALQGISRIRALDWRYYRDILVASVELKEEKIPFNQKTETLCKSLINTAQKVISASAFLPKEMGVLLEQLEERPLKLLYTVATLIRLKPAEQQQLLETSGGKEKFELLMRLLSRELEFIKLGGKIQSSVRKEFDKTQREVFLRQRLKAIQKELGEENPLAAEIKEIKKRLKKVGLPPEAKKEVDIQIKRLEVMHPMSGEYQVVRTYLDWVLDLPWNVSTKDNLSLRRAQKVLDEDHYDLKEIKERLIEYLAVRKLRKDLKSPILCFVGPPGVGKTSLGKSIARALGRKFVRISLGGIRDEAEIRGHRRTYVGALPGRIIQGIKRAETNNPVFMLDEIDKVGADFRGDPSSALLEVLDPEQNSTFRDHYLDLAFDLSKVMFIATANVLETMHPALLDRMEIIEIPGYTAEEKIFIAEKFLLPRQIKEHGLNEKQVVFERKALERIILEYTREAGVRNLEREIAKIVRKVAKKVAQKKTKGERITAGKVPRYLGPQKAFPEVKRRLSAVGVATGLAVTSSGGDILFIEARKMPGGKKLTLTGNLGDVMKESASTALSLIRSRAKELKIDKKFFEKNDLHLHVPAGAIPKDGPSAGVAMVCALASLMTGRKVKNDVAMTGEITLSGLVLPVGGVKQKVLAARAAGIKKVILPQKNKGDLEKIEKHIRKDLGFILVENVDEVLREALVSP
ncbi:endopeptidase La [candidate division CPR3 bacterium 4484_211]|uniref:Lon protease n=1 Tax=candidate division CPR3 bacterium 4484_211 TaxID=1968527 RepID=A0A1W9NZU5_UNCC3|nr:MAG: endopeptidase La [candidate division CPR3 bacterium 4484_211]